ncbi:MAG: CusA/CzcA family heavy metal efflux RND transporter [Planctomycetes bacterium]|nr:CusA/CzcA family heavy metal efflux RND transporter [Planctomycetota bacterium]
MLERILRFSVAHRWIVVLVTLLAGGVGVHALSRLPIDAVPDITNNQIQINTQMESLSPVEIERQVTFPIETALAGIPGLSYTRSLSRNGFSQVTAVFDDAVDIYFARSQVTERLNEASEGLPGDAEPRMGPISTGLGEVYMWTVEYEHPGGEGAEKRAGRYGWQPDGSYLTPEGQHLRNDFERAAYLRTVQDWIIRPQIKTVRDVAGVDAIGGYVKQYHVQPDPMKLVAHGLTFHDVIEALERNNASTGAGYVEHKGEAYVVRAAGRIADIEEIGEIVVGAAGGTPLRVRDVAKFGLGRELRTGSATENGEEVVVGTALMLIGANSRTVAADVDVKLKEVQKSLPADIRAKAVLNRTKLVDATIATVQKNLVEGALLVIAVLFLLLGNIRAALITACAIPLSMLLTAIGMVETKTSGNLMSLGAVDFGLIVDGAVIVIENTLRRLAERQHAVGRRLALSERLHEVIEASREMIRPSAFGQAIIITVYLPILTLTGVEGKMFRPMAMTVIFALVAAFVLSLTLIPALAAIGLGGKISEKENFLVRGVKSIYEPVLRFALRMRWAVVGAAVLAFVGSVALFQSLGQEFVPTLDEKDLAMHAMRIPSTGITQSTEMQRDVERTISKFPEVAFVFSKTGTAEMASDPMPPSVSDTFVIFKPREQWANPEETKPELLSRIEVALGSVPGNNYEFTQPIQMRFNELIAGVRSDVAVKLFGEDFDELVPAANRIAEVLRGVPGSAAVKVEQTEGLPVLTIHVDRAAIARYGLSVADVQDVVAIAIGGRGAGEVFEGDRRFDLIVRLPDEVRRDLAALGELPIPVTNADGSGADSGDASGGGARPTFVPLSTVARMEIAEGLNQVSRENGKRRIVIQSNVRGRDMGSFVVAAKAAIERDVKLPPGSWITWGGQFENLEAARARLLIVVPACFLLIFVLLFGAFGNAKYAVLVFTCVPLALTGGIVSLWLRDMPFSISAAVGFIALSGVAVLNGLVMITYINQLRNEGAPLEDGILRGSLTRLRPVMMTALVASLGFVPMAIATGTGAEVQRPLATVVIGGIVSSTLLTLVVLPALYRMWHRVDEPSPAAEEAAEAAPLA